MSSIEILSQNPKILIKKSFLDDAKCHEIKKNFNTFQRSKIVHKNKNIVDDYRTSSSCSIDMGNDKVLPLIKKISELVNLPIQNCEPVIFTKYKKGEEYKGHFDFLEGSSECQRLITAILYLDECSGGETCFDKLNLSITPKTGMLLLFENCFPSTTHLNPLTYHSSKPVLYGEKNILTFWFRNNRF